ncbi:hypothetical protein ECG_07626 [Echinococcus granulosus]|nr:hypothetical protein ECG_07626 [Echinococcus granulosus]
MHSLAWHPSQHSLLNFITLISSSSSSSSFNMHLRCSAFTFSSTSPPIRCCTPRPPPPFSRNPQLTEDASHSTLPHHTLQLGWLCCCPYCCTLITLFPKANNT